MIVKLNIHQVQYHTFMMLILHMITIDSNIINTGNKSPVEAVIVDLTISNLLLNDK